MFWKFLAVVVLMIAIALRLDSLPPPHDDDERDWFI